MQLPFVFCLYNSAISDIDNYFNPSEDYFGIQVRLIQKTYFESLVRISPATFWTRIWAHYFVASPPNFQLGIFSVGNAFLLETKISENNDTSIQVYKAEKVVRPLNLQTTPQENNFTVHVFVAGIKTSQTNIQLSVTRSQLNLRELSITYQLIGASIPLESLQLSYIIYDSSSSSLFLEKIPSSVLELPIPLQEKFTNQNFFIGIKGIQADKSKSLVNNVSPETNQLKLKNFSLLFPLQGFIIQKLN